MMPVGRSSVNVVKSVEMPASFMSRTIAAPKGSRPSLVT